MIQSKPALLLFVQSIHISCIGVVSSSLRKHLSLEVPEHNTAAWMMNI